MEALFQCAGAFLVAGALKLARLEVANAGECAGGDRWRQRRREDEARGVGADRVAEVLAAGDVAAHNAETFGQRAVEDVDARGLAVAFGYAAAARAVHADGVHLVDVGERVILLGEVADLFDGGDVAVHRVHALECDQLGQRGIGCLQ